MGVTPDHHPQLRLPDTTEDRRPVITKDHTWRASCGAAVHGGIGLTAVSGRGYVTGLRA